MRISGGIGSCAEIEVTGEVAEDGDILPHRGTGIGTPLVLAVEALPTEEPVLDQLQERIEREDLVIDVQVGDRPTG